MTSDQNNETDRTTRPTMMPVRDARETTEAAEKTGRAERRNTFQPRMGPRPTAHEIIAQRGPSHGDFDDNAILSQQLKDTIRSFQRKDGSYPWHELTPVMKEALDMDCLKTSRAVTGRADFRDHWADKAGYATLVADRCPD